MREDEDKHAEMIHFLRNNTSLSRLSRSEVRDFIERLEVEGYEITKKDRVNHEALDALRAMDGDAILGEEPAVES